jgi:hypothetical protein
MIAPGSPGPIRTDGEYSGTWVELQDRRGRVLLDRVLNNPFRRMLAVHYPPGISNRVTPGSRRPGEFSAIVPAIPEATTIAVWSSPLEAERRNETAQEIARFDLSGGTTREANR